MGVVIDNKHMQHVTDIVPLNDRMIRILIKWPAKSIGTVAVRRLRLLDMLRVPLAAAPVRKVENELPAGTLLLKRFLMLQHKH